MSRKITIVHCPREYASTCKHYKMSVEYRSVESKNRGVALVLAVIGLVIAGLDDVNSPGWFVTLILYLASSIGTSFFYSKDIPIKKACYLALNVYSVVILIACFLGLAGVLIVEDSMLALTTRGVYVGNEIMPAHYLFYALFLVPIMDGFAWVISAFMDSRTQS